MQASSLVLRIILLRELLPRHHSMSNTLPLRTQQAECRVCLDRTSCHQIILIREFNALTRPVSFLGGGFIGAIIQWPISSRWGRHICTATATVIVLISSACITGSTTLAIFLVFRVICGIGAGMLIANTPVHMSEVAPPHTRGVLVSAQGIAIAGAYTVSSLTALGIHLCSMLFRVAFARFPMVQFKITHIPAPLNHLLAVAGKNCTTARH